MAKTAAGFEEGYSEVFACLACLLVDLRTKQYTNNQLCLFVDSFY